MTHLIAFAVANSNTIMSILAALLTVSEALPFIRGTQAEGIIHGIAGLLSRSAPPVQK